MAIASEIKLLLVDLDGTLLSSQLRISERNLCTLNKAADAGVQTVLVSGRPASSIASFSRHLSKNQFIVASNGAVIVELPQMELLRFSRMEEGLVEGVLGIAAQQNVSLCLYAPLEWFSEHLDAGTQLEIHRSGTRPTIFKDFKNIQKPIVKALLIGEKDSLVRCEESLSKLFKSQLDWFYSYPEYLEIMPRGVSKGTACKYLMTHLSIDSQYVLALGDGSSDRSMLACAKFGVAVENAVDSLLSTATYITLSNDNDGVAAAIDAFVFGEPQFVSIIRRLTANVSKRFMH